MFITKTKTLLDELTGVMFTDIPVKSVNVALDVEKVSVLVVCTTCNTFPRPSAVSVLFTFKLSTVNVPIMISHKV